MEPQEHIINRYLIIGWTAIVVILFVAYTGEVLKGERTLSYLIVFMLFTGIPALLAILLYKRNPVSDNLKYYIVIGYFIMYTFVMITGNTSLVFTYIFPMLSLIVLYRRKNLIVGMGIAAFLINLLFIIIRVFQHQINTGNSKDIEIQIALIFLCFSGSYIAAGLYGSVTEKNREYTKMLDEKTKEIQKMTFQAITVIANTIDAKDEYTKGHSQRVSEYSYALAKELGLEEKEAQDIRNIALLHDIGKIGVPDSVLNKPGKLTDSEYEIMKQHPIVGADILKDIKMIPGLDIGAKYHHERYDGKGYPSGLKGEDIPFIARIICVADAYDAMSSNRVYRKRFSEEKILEELERSRGTQFDPQIAEAFIRLLKEKKIKPLIPGIVERREKPVEMIIPESLLEPQQKKNLLDELSDIKRIKSVEKSISAELERGDGCLLLIDVDNIGEINKNYGYIRGDYCLVTVAKALTKQKKNLIVSRVGGDEFLCFIPEISSIMDAEKMVMNLLHMINTRISKIEELKGITLSAGVALSVVSGREYSKLYMDADKALYHIKQEGKNGFYIYNDNGKENDKYMSSQDLDNLVHIIQKEYSYQGAFKVDYPEFEKVYEFIRNIGKRNAQTIQLVLFTIKPVDERTFAMEDRTNVMQYVESAIVNTVRTVDVTTRYSSTQQMVIFMNVENDSIHIVIDRILKEFYKMYDKRDVTLTYDVANLDFDGDEENEKKEITKRKRDDEKKL